MTTKERILDSALTLFSENGYNGTSVEQIAEMVGIKAPSLYKHFKGKEEILNTLVEDSDKYYDETFGSVDHIGRIPDSLEEFVSDTMKRIRFTMHDPVVLRMRKLVVQEQFRNERLAETASKHQLYGIQRMYSKIVKELMAQGKMVEDEPELMAMEITAPVVLYLAQADRQPETQKKALKDIEKHIRHFCETYRGENW